MTIFDQLAEPFAADVISWRAQSVSNKEGRAPAAMALAYIDARDVMRRLDEVCGPGNWQNRYPHAGSKTICEIGIKHDGEWIWKANGAGDTDIEAEKGAISDGFKRAAVMWGIGRYLYDMPTVWAECELDSRGKWKCWTPKGLETLRRTGTVKVATAAPTAPVSRPDPDAYIDEKQRVWLAEKIDVSQTDIASVCRHFQIQSIKELKVGELKGVRDWIEAQRKAA